LTKGKPRSHKRASRTSGSRSKRLRKSARMERRSTPLLTLIKTGEVWKARLVVTPTHLPDISQLTYAERRMILKAACDTLLMELGTLSHYLS